MKTLLRNQKCFEITPVFVNGFRKMTSLGVIMCLFLIFSFSDNTYAQTSNLTSDQPSLQNTAGTFQFESPSGIILFWRMDFIESLYPGIESRRAIEHNTIWHFSADMDIIIFAKNIITSSDFVPLESPYNGLKEFKY